jgi:hypothetical protein
MATDNGMVLNEMFLARLDSPEGKEKIAAYGSNYIRDRLREEGFLRKVLPPMSVSASDPTIQVSMNHDTLVKVVEMEPWSRGMSMSFRGQPEAHYYTGVRFEAPFSSIGSLRYEQTEQELLAYRMPITKIIKRHIVNDIQEVEDRVALNHWESACQSLQQDAQNLTFGATYADADAFTARNVAAGMAEVGKVKGVDVIANTVAATDALGCDETLIFPVQKDDFIKMFQLFAGNGATAGTSAASRLECDKFLITNRDFEDINAWALSDMGDKIVGETSVDGYKYQTVIGRKFIKTLKTDILRPGNIYAFCAPEFLGGFCVLNKLKFYADKERNKISFEAWEDICVYIANVAAVRKMELYAGSVEPLTTPANNATTRANRLPVGEESLGALNSLVEEDQFFPQVTDF